VQFEWDPVKAEENLRKHGVSFDEATTVFGDPLSTTVPDPDHSLDEDRSLITGRLLGTDRVVVVSHTDRGSSVRIIGARQATAAERRVYESGE
jgi:uncharacterized DUF497 family protein